MNEALRTSMSFTTGADVVFICGAAGVEPKRPPGLAEKVLLVPNKLIF
jgi:hypothetical protein